MTRLALLVLRCIDIEATRSFYELLGLRFERQRHGSGPEHFASEDSDVIVELYPAIDARAVSTERLGFVVASLEHTVTTIAARGGRVRSKPALSEFGFRAVIEDPDGRAVELVQGW